MAFTQTQQAEEVLNTRLFLASQRLAIFFFYFLSLLLLPSLSSYYLFIYFLSHFSQSCYLFRYFDFKFPQFQLFLFLSLFFLHSFFFFFSSSSLLHLLVLFILYSSHVIPLPPSLTSISSPFILSPSSKTTRYIFHKINTLSFPYSFSLLISLSSMWPVQYSFTNLHFRLS